MLGKLPSKPELSFLESSADIDAPTLTFLTERAEQIRVLGKRVISDVIEIGRLLVECRDHPDMKHGNWQPWLKREFGWSDQQARRFIHVYELSHEGKFNNLLNLDVPISGLYQLAAPSTPDSAREEVITRAESGGRLKHAEVQAIIAAHSPAAVREAAALLQADDDGGRRGGMAAGVTMRPYADRGLDLWGTPPEAVWALLRVESLKGGAASY